MTEADTPNGYSKEPSSKYVREVGDGVLYEIEFLKSSETREIYFRMTKATSIQNGEKAYDTVSYDKLGSTIENPSNRRQLDIATESIFIQAQNSNLANSYIRFRDANVIAHVLWRTRDTSISLENIGQLAVNIHNKWR
ncbi:hypothetical protein [Halovenus salina]|uniref:hypothetical protein n=1 Tax=Halovenus salina TaxID=1510225 RepID=UPI002260BC24|nr:hypothetical protein [Halovenus salina]